MISGVYWIINRINNYIYIGSSKDFIGRKCHHRSELKRGVSEHPLLQAAVNEYGLNNFVIRVLITCHPDMLLFYEQQFIDQWKPEYNMSPVAGSQKGIKFSENAVYNMAQSHRGKRTLQARHNISAGLIGTHNFLGHKHSEETKRKIAESRKGCKHSEETKQKIKDAWKRRKCASHD